ncbi:MAG: ABC transporter ATP-binding protein [Oscillospiraceae bacterium]|nr:ABC transporter ATP-binding protein [Oscillospiraceae bacterium]
MSNVILKVENITKTYAISKKQQKIEKAKLSQQAGRASKTAPTVITANDNVSFTANKGEIFGLLGPNGAGKTTTLRIMSTLIKADSGDVFIDGFSVKNESTKVRGRIGFLTSELKMEEFFTPNYLFDFFSNLYGLDPTKQAAYKKEIFEKFGIDKFAEVKVANMSQGMKQKTSLVISLVHDPDVVIFDEPTNGLDVVTAKVVTDFLRDLRERGKCIIVSTHIFSLVEQLCDRVGIIIAGQMVMCDTLAEITKERTMEEVFFDLYKKTVGEVD